MIDAGLPRFSAREASGDETDENPAAVGLLNLVQFGVSKDSYNLRKKNQLKACLETIIQVQKPCTHHAKVL